MGLEPVLISVWDMLKSIFGTIWQTFNVVIRGEVVSFRFVRPADKSTSSSCDGVEFWLQWDWVMKPGTLSVILDGRDITSSFKSVVFPDSLLSDMKARLDVAAGPHIVTARATFETMNRYSKKVSEVQKTCTSSFTVIQGDFSLEIVPWLYEVERCTYLPVIVKLVKSGGFDNNVYVYADPLTLVSGIKCDPVKIYKGEDQGKLYFIVDYSAPEDSYDITIVGISNCGLEGEIKRTNLIGLKPKKITMSISATPSSLTLQPCKTVDVQVNIIRGAYPDRYNGYVDVSIEKLPPGITCDPITIEAIATQGILTLKASGTPTPFNGNIQIKAGGRSIAPGANSSCNDVVETCTVYLDAPQAGDFSITVPTKDIILNKGASVQIELDVTVLHNQFPETITFTMTTDTVLPSGVTASPCTTNGLSSSQKVGLALTADNTAKFGNTKIKITGQVTINGCVKRVHTTDWLNLIITPQLGSFTEAFYQDCNDFSSTSKRSPNGNYRADIIKSGQQIFAKFYNNTTGTLITSLEIHPSTYKTYRGAGFSPCSNIGFILTNHDDSNPPYPFKFILFYLTNPVIRTWTVNSVCTTKDPNNKEIASDDYQPRIWFSPDCSLAIFVQACQSGNRLSCSNQYSRNRTAVAQVYNLDTKPNATHLGSVDLDAQLLDWSVSPWPVEIQSEIVLSQDPSGVTFPYVKIDTKINNFQYDSNTKTCKNVLTQQQGKIQIYH